MFGLFAKSIVFVLLALGIYEVTGDGYDNCEVMDVYDCVSRNPCKQRRANDGFYFAHDEAKKFVQCDNFDQCFTKDCAQGTVWSQLQLTCTGGIAFDVL